MKRFTFFVLLALVFGGGLILGSNLDLDKNPLSGKGENGDLPEPIKEDLVREVWNIIHEKYVGDIADDKLANGVLRGLVFGLNDPYSAFANKEETNQFSEDISGSITGIGIEISRRDGMVTVVSPLRGSPAERAGIKGGDVIIAVDGEDITADMSLTEAAGKIRGPIGTQVKLTILREQAEKPLEVSVARERIKLTSVDARTQNGIGIIELSAFNEDTPAYFNTAVGEILSDEVRGLVLDMRNNPGGILDAAVDIAGHFVKEGEEIVREVPANPEEKVIHHASGPGDLREMPVVIIINEGSASAAEILAAALRDLKGIPLVGKGTFGKGSVQELIQLSNGASLRLTVAKWKTPSGKEISERGIEPDYEVTEDNGEGGDPALEKAIEILSN